MKILVTPTSFLKPENHKAKELLEDFAGEVVYNPFGRPLKSEEVAEFIKDCEGYIAGLDYIDGQALKHARKLAVISRYGAGVDRVDLAAAKSMNITVTNTPGTNAVSVSELAMGLMLALARSITRLDAAVKTGQWPRNDGIELCGKSLSILGLGAIGKNIAMRAKAFDMTINAYDPFMNEAFARQNGINVMSFEDAVSGADFISLHMPLNESTRHLIDSKVIEKMKQGAILINTARGGLIDEAAAYEALKSGKLGGLALDAHEKEPVCDSPLAGFSNVILTPHTGAHTKEAVRNMGMMAVENLIKVLKREECTNVVA